MRIRRLISIVLFAAIVVIGVFYYIRHRESFQPITTVSIGAILLLSALKLTLMLCHGSQLKMLKPWQTDR